MLLGCVVCAVNNLSEFSESLGNSLNFSECLGNTLFIYSKFKFLKTQFINNVSGIASKMFRPLFPKLS